MSSNTFLNVQTKYFVEIPGFTLGASDTVAQGAELETSK